MIEPPVDVAGLQQQLADLAVADAMPLEILLRLAEVIFPGRTGIGDPGRTVWPEPWRARASRRADGELLDAQERLEAQIRQSEVRFQSLVEQLPAVVFYAALGDEDNEVYVSPQIEALLGFTQNEWLTNPLLWYSQLHPDDHDVVIDAFTRGVQTGDPFRAEVRFRTRDGEEVWILGEARLIFDDVQRPAYFQGVAFDITPTKRAQAAVAQAEQVKAEAAQLEADALAARNVQLTKLNELLRIATDKAHDAAAARSTFLTTMSHELRTPLNSVIVLSGLLADSELSPGQSDMVRSMRLASDHLLELIDDILEFSRLRAGHLDLARKPFDLGDWVVDCLDIIAPRADEKGIELRHRLAADVPRTLVSDEGRLRQVLLNLLGNAVKFTARGHIEVRVTARPVEAVELSDERHRWQYECSVIDTGIGIKPGARATLFDEFRQADSGIAREFGGTGLGLAISSRLCELLGGRIWVEPDRDPPGPGASFTFTWVAEADPLSVNPDETLGRREVPESDRVMVPALVAPPAAGSLRILLVEDDLMNQQVAGLLLGAIGYRADVVSSGAEALEAVVSSRYDVVLMDVAMPGMDGIQATEAIRRLGDAIRQPVVVALTALALPGDLEACLEAGMDAYVAKPINRVHLSNVLAAAAESREMPSGTGSGTGTADGGGTRPAIDFDPLAAARIGKEFGAEPLRRLLAIFRSQSSVLATAAADAVAADDANGAMRAAHTLKSSAANIGAVGLAAACAALEASARAGSLEGATARVTAIATYLADANERLAAIERGLPAG